jgi:hypothetical protein
MIIFWARGGFISSCLFTSALETGAEGLQLSKRTVRIVIVMMVLMRMEADFFFIKIFLVMKKLSRENVFTRKE